MKVLYLDPHPVPDTTPEALQILQTADALSRCGAEVDLVAPAPPHGKSAEAILGRPLSPGLRLQPTRDFRRAWWFPSGSSKLFYREARAIVATSNADVVLVRNLKLAEALLTLRRRPPLFFETHEIFAQSYRESNPIPNWRQRAKLAALTRREEFVYRHANGLLALTQLLMDDIRTTYAVTTPAVVVPDGVDLELARQALSSASSFDEKNNKVLYLGSLHPWKGVETLVQAAVDLPQAKIQIAGGTSARIAELHNLANALDVADRIEFLGPVAPAERFHIIGAARVCVLPLTATSIATRYTSPLKLFEYMAMGRAIVAADTPAIREVLTNERDALLVLPEDSCALASAIARLLAEPDMAQQLGAEAQRHVAERYSWEARAGMILDFRSMIAKAQPRHLAP